MLPLCAGNGDGLGVRRDLVHGEGGEGSTHRGAGRARLFENVDDVSEGHGGIGDALRPTMLADRWAARHPDTHIHLAVPLQFGWPPSREQSVQELWSGVVGEARNS